MIALPQVLRKEPFLSVAALVVKNVERDAALEPHAYRFQWMGSRLSGWSGKTTWHRFDYCCGGVRST